jgi:hypothetical protein
MTRAKALSIVTVASLGLASANGCGGGAPAAKQPINYTFDHGTEGWVLNKRGDTSLTNLGAIVPDGGSPSTVTFVESDGDPNPGSLRLRATFTAQGQYAAAGIVFAQPRDLSSKTLAARVRLVSGPTAGLRVGLYVCSDAPPPCTWGGLIDVAELTTGAWAPLAFDVVPPMPSIGYLPTPTFFSTARIVELGIEIMSFTEPHPGELVFDIDTVTESATGMDGGVGDVAADGAGDVKSTDATTTEGGGDVPISSDADAADAAAAADAGDASAVVDGSVVSQPVTIPASANLWGAGRVAPPDPSGRGPGVLPILVTLPVGTNRTLKVTNVSGTVDFDGAGELPTAGADGIVFTDLPALPADTPDPAFMGLAGVKEPPCPTAPCTARLEFLAAVFLDAAAPADPAPAAHVVDPAATTIDGLMLRQTFFVGDGLAGATAGAGAVQTFRIPDEATRLYFGFFDAYGGGPIGSYDDNVGRLQATVTIMRGL